MDLACGKGRFAQIWRRHTSFLRGVDANTRRLRVAERLGLYDNLTHTAEPWNLVRGHDLVVCTFLIEHLAKPIGNALVQVIQRSPCDYIIATDSVWNPNFWPVPGRTRFDLHRSYWSAEDFNGAMTLQASNGRLRDLLYGRTIVAYRMDGKEKVNGHAMQDQR